jgi:hypothetical protein
MKKFFSIVSALVLALTSSVPAANAQTVIVGQIVENDLVLTKAQSPYLVTGLLQIPAGRTLVVQPGAEVTFASGSGIRAIGDVKIGELGGSERVKITLNTSLHLVGNGNRAPTVTIYRADIYGNNSQLVYGCRKLEIVESYLEKISQIVAEQECPSLSIRDSYLNEVKNVYEGFFDGAPMFFELTNNAIVSMNAICCRISDRTMGSSDKTAIYKVTNNDFRNLENLNIPWGYVNYTFSGNNLLGVKNARIVKYFGLIANSTTEKVSGNYWGPNATDDIIRKTVNVVDGKSDIGISKVLAFEPVAPTSTSLSGFPAGRQAEIDKAAADKAAADKAAADKAAAAAKRYPNCAALQKVYSGGVARSAKWVNQGGKIKLKPTVNSKVYNLNKSLDRDKDGIACER